MKRILIVDDAAFIRLTLRTMLEKNGFEVVGEAGNGMIAVAKYKELSPDVVTMDITMPEVDGLQATKMIRALDPNAKIIIVSALGQESIVKKAIIEGATGFIVKPFKEAFVVDTLNKI